MNFSDSEKFTALSLAKASEILYTENMKTILTILLCLTTLAGCTPAPESGMDIYTFSIGKADCSLLSFDGINVLIDTGEEDDVIAQIDHLMYKNKKEYYKTHAKVTSRDNPAER